MFTFRFKPLQKIRENVRRERQAELAKALEAETVVRDKIESIVKDIAKVADDLRGAASGEWRVASDEENSQLTTRNSQLNVDVLIGLRRHEAWLLAQKHEAQEKLEQVLVEVERRRLAVVEADKEVKIMEKLHEKQKDKYDAEQSAKEIVAFDEIASQRAARGIHHEDHEGTRRDHPQIHADKRR